MQAKQKQEDLFHGPRLHPTLLLGKAAADREALGYAGRTTASRCLSTLDGGVVFGDQNLPSVAVCCKSCRW